MSDPIFDAACMTRRIIVNQCGEGQDEQSGFICDFCGNVISRNPEDVTVIGGGDLHAKCAQRYVEKHRSPAHEFRPLCSKCGEVASTFQLFNEFGKWRLVFEGSCAGTGSSGDEITDELARAIIAGFTEPYTEEGIRSVGFYDSGGYCFDCRKFYCSTHWHISTTGGGNCPKGHFKSLDPLWSPDFDDI